MVIASPQNNPGYRRSLTAVLLAAVSITHSGCTLFSAPAEEPVFENSGRLAIVPAPVLPVVEFAGFESGRSGGALHTAGRTFVHCLGGLGQGSCSGSICGAALTVGLGLCGVAGVVGGIYGAVSTPDAKTMEAHEAAMMMATYSTLIQTPLRNHVVDAALENFAQVVDVPSTTNADVDANEPDYRHLASSGADTVLEVGLTRVRTEAVDNGERLNLVMEARARVVSTADNSELTKENFSYTFAESHALNEWSADRGKLLAEALQESYEPLAHYIYTKMFVVYPFPDRSFKGFPIATFGLAPIHPRLSLPPLFSPLDKSTAVDSLQPTLSWESFPRHEDTSADPRSMNRVRHVRYDLRVAPVNVVEHDGHVDMQPGKCIIDRQNLESPAYSIEQPLARASLYVWTVRARFELDGRTWVTEWASQWHPGDHQAPPSPSLLSYMFRTP